MVVCAHHLKVHRWLRSGGLQLQASLGENGGQTPAQWKRAGNSSAYLSSQQDKRLKIGGLQSRLAWAKARPCLQNNQSKKGWRCGSSGRVSAMQARSPKFKKKKKQKKQDLRR
jgi:hypothetical protein